jgi:hypothetical protein
MKKALYVLTAILFLLVMTNPNHGSFQKFLGQQNITNTNRKANFLVCSIYSANDKNYLAILNEFYNISEHNNNSRSNSRPAADSIKTINKLQTENPLKTGD